MIACSSFSRFDRLWKAARVAASLSNPLRYSQVCLFQPNMGKTKDGSISLKQKKSKILRAVWRPISTESASHKGDAAKDIQVNSRDSHGIVDCTERSSVECSNVPFGIFSQDEPSSGGITSLASSDTSPNNESRCEDLKVRPVSSSCDMGHMPESFECRSISESEKTIHNEKVKGETVIDSTNKMDAEHVNKVAKLSVPVEVDSSLIRLIKGKGGSTQKQIEEATGVKIIFPSSKEANCLILEGTSAENLSKASNIIAGVLEEGVKSPKLDYSHFISLPLAIYPELVEKLHNFQTNIIGDSTSGFDNSDSDSSQNSLYVGDDAKQSEKPEVAVNLVPRREKEHTTVKADSKKKADVSADLGIEKSIFIKPKTFHLTVLMLKLWNKDLVAKATETLQKISTKVNDALDNRPVSIKLKGLECMRGSPTKARVLYAPVKEIGDEGRLLHACQVIIEAFVEAGLVLEKDAQQALKLHATLMNARHRKWKKGTKRRDYFDARWILRRYGSEEWGDYVIRGAHLSRRFSFDENGYYHCCASIPFPESMKTE